MDIWLVTIGEPVPVQEGARDHLHRTGCLAHFLADKGHNVIWWTSTFDHFRKKHWFDRDTTIALRENLRIRMLHGPGYSKNLSLARLRDHRRIAKKFAALARDDGELPDIIVAALPTVELCLEAVRFGKDRFLPVVLDMRDMWPDIFVDMVPRLLRPLARFLISPMVRRAQAACAGATAIIGITDEFVDWGLCRGSRPRSALDRSFPMAYISAPPPPERVREAEGFWDGQGIPRDKSAFVACFVGALGKHFDLNTVLQVARRLQEQHLIVRFVICGSGDRLERLRAVSRDLQNVLLPGWVDAAQIYVLMRRASVGLDPLPERYDFLATINNKAVEYLSAALPIVSSPERGVLSELLAREACGFSYATGDVTRLAEILTRLAEEPNVLQAMAENAGRVFRERFTAEKIFGGMTGHLEQLVREWARSACG